MATMTKDARLAEVGKNAAASIVEMVAAFECDYDRLKELRDERDGFSMDEDCIHAPDGPGYANSAEAWATENPDDSAELVELEEAAGDCKDQDEARERIQEDALSVRVFGERIDGEWQADRFEILLTTGGPAVRIMGELDGNCEPDRAWLEVQDWGAPWTEHYESGLSEVLLSYCRCFCFGE